MKKIVAILLMLAVLAMVACAGGEVAAPKKQNMFMGGSSATSSTHMVTIAMAHIWNTHIPEINVTPVETKASQENQIALEDGRFQLAGSQTISSTGKAMWKIPPFDVRGVSDGLRTLFQFRTGTEYPIYVRADSGIKSHYDLNGKKLSPGIRGSTTAYDVELFLKGLGVKPEYFYGSYAESNEAIKEGRIDACMVTMKGHSADATVLDALTTTKLNMLSITEEEQSRFKQSKEQAEMPFLGFYTVPAGAIKAFPGHPAVTFLDAKGSVPIATFKGCISQELGYKMVKVMVDNWEDLYVVFPASKEFLDVYPDVATGTIKETVDDNEFYWDKFQEFHPGLAPQPLHPGTVQWLKELGYDVPELIIPPEYKP